jgi:DNA-binding CsgD family transcriptional regulator
MQLQQFMDISQAPDLALFERRLIDFAHNMDFGIMTATLVVERIGLGASVSAIGNVPMGYQHNSAQEVVNRDPVIRRMKRLSIPFAYDQTLYVNEDSADLWEEQAPFGFHTGVAVALHMPAGRHFLIGFDREAPLPTDENRLTRLFADLQLVAVHAQDAAQRLMDPDPSAMELAANPIELSRREVQVLQWAMVGKTSGEMARIMALSENTVNFHVRNAMAKLDCTSRSQAVLKALSLGLL